MWTSFSEMAVQVILFLLALLWLVYKYITWNYTYWKDRSVPYAEPHFPFGTEKDLMCMKVSFSDHYQNLYNRFKNEKMIGAYTINEPYLIIKDPELIKQIMVKDFQNFVNRGLFEPDLLTPTSKDLFSIEGEYWKGMRAKLTPAFTSGKMKMMYLLIEACVDQFRESLCPLADGKEKIDLKDFMARFTTDVIASCAFGLESNSIKNPDNEIRRNGKILFKPLSVLAVIQQNIYFLTPRIYRLLRLPLFSTGADDFFKKLVHDTVEYREKTGSVRNDFIDVLMKIKHNKILSDDDINEVQNGKSNEISEPGLTLDEMTAQALLFFAAGFETAASTMTFCLYELSLNPDIQLRVYKEVEEVLQRHSGRFSYQAIQEMTYLEAVINETLRRYASLSFLNRKCTKEYKIPDSNLVIPKDLRIIIPLYSIHHDPKYYPNPYKFDPERFLNDGTKTKNNFTYMPFGEGPRMCIGNRFGLLQMKSCLSMMIKNFQFSVTEETQIPVKLDKHTFTTTPEAPIILKISNRRAAAVISDIQ